MFLKGRKCKKLVFEKNTKNCPINTFLEKKSSIRIYVCPLVLNTIFSYKELIKYSERIQ